MEAAKILLIETNFSLNKFDTVKTSVFSLFSLSAIMILQFFFCLPVGRFNSLKKRFGEFKNRVSRSLKYSRFPDRRCLQTRFLSFGYLVLLDGVRYHLYLLNANFRRIIIFFISLSNQVLFDFASFIFFESENFDGCCECISQTFNVASYVLFEKKVIGNHLILVQLNRHF